MDESYTNKSDRLMTERTKEAEAIEKLYDVTTTNLIDELMKAPMPPKNENLLCHLSRCLVLWQIDWSLRTLKKDELFMKEVFTKSLLRKYAIEYAATEEVNSILGENRQASTMMHHIDAAEKMWIKMFFEFGAIRFLDDYQKKFDLLVDILCKESGNESWQKSFLARTHIFISVSSIVTTIHNNIKEIHDYFSR
jgi:hypothetical protein